MRQATRAAIVSLVIWGSEAEVAHSAPISSACNPTSVGLDLANANRGEGTFSGRSLAQVFFAPDTLLSAVTVWRYPEPDSNITPMQLFITGTDSTNFGAPDPRTVLLVGPTLVYAHNSDVPGLVRYDIVPPLALPHPGSYAFLIKDASISCEGSFGLEADSSDAYAQGGLYYLSPSLGCSGPGHAPQSFDREDLVFQVEFCLPMTAALPETWGRVKTRYR